MEYVSGGVKLRDIFLDNGNWWKLFLKHRNLTRPGIITNVIKLLVCKTSLLGYHIFVCPKCTKSIKTPHSCKSRFCPSCGKKATDNWIKTSFNTLPHTKWQHITFTMPDKFWDFFWVNRHLQKKLPLIAANIILKLAAQKKFKPAIYLAIHTSGRDLKRNIHIHLSTTVGGLALDNKSWIQNSYFYHETLKKMWRYEIITLFRDEFKNGNLKLPPHLKHIKTYSAFRSWTELFYNKTWVVHLGKQSENMQHIVKYLGRYLKRPPIGETRIKKYDGKTVTFEYLDHYQNTTELLSLPVLDFIARLISHIPDKNFRNIRYYGFLSNRNRGVLLPIVQTLLGATGNILKKVYTHWRDMIKRNFNYDPLKCSNCGTIMISQGRVYPARDPPLIDRHEEIARGHFALI